MEEKGKGFLSLTAIGIIVFLVSMTFVLVLLATPAAAQPVKVWVNAPEHVEEGATFIATIGVNSIEDFCAGIFDLSFDHKVAKVEEVTDGCIDNTEIPVTMWAHMDSDTIEVMLELPGRYGIYLDSSSDNTITGNTMNSNGIFIHSCELQDWNTHTIENNTVNGKPLYYFKNRIGGKVPEDAGQIILANCTGMKIENLSITDTDAGIVLEFSSENTVKNSNISNSDYGIYLYNSSNNTITGSTVSNNGKGIYLWKWKSNHNIIYLNNFINNTENADSYNPTNIWNSTEKITYAYNGSTFTNYLGNYWDDYRGTDADKDGLGDFPYSIDLDKDYHPLMSPFEYYFIPVENIFDTGPSKNPYPSIAGTHNGSITPSRTINVSALYTYACEGTGGHTEYVRIWNESGIIAEAHWNGYKSDWHNISFPESFVLEAGKTYNYTIRTGSYPQIHHKNELEVDGGIIKCNKFTDTSGKIYNNWIPAIRLDHET